MRRSITFAAAALLLAAGASRATAQFQELRPVDMKGKVEKTSEGMISLKCESREIYLKVDPRTTRVECKGTAEESYLRPGVLVRFRSEFDKKGVAKEDLKELSIVSPSETNEPGLTADSISGDPEKSKPKVDAGPLQVVGTIKQIKDGQMVVQAGSRAVRCKLAKDAELNVDLDDYTLAGAGDEILFKGRMPQPQPADTPNQVYGDEITITFAKPLAGETKGKAKPKPVKNTPAPKKKPGSDLPPVRRPSK